MAVNKDIQHFLKKVSEGNAHAFSKLYEQYHAKVYNFLKKYLKSGELCDDLTQEVFLKLWTEREKLSAIENFDAYLFTVSKNLAFNFLKRASLDVTAKGIIVKAYKHEPSPENQLDTKDYINYLQQLLNTLTPQSREVFRLCRQQNLSYDEAAAILGISRSAIKKHMVRSMKSLRDAVQKDLNIPLQVLLLIVSKKIF